MASMRNGGNTCPLNDHDACSDSPKSALLVIYKVTKLMKCIDVLVDTYNIVTIYIATYNAMSYMCNTCEFNKV